MLFLRLVLIPVLLLGSASRPDTAYAGNSVPPLDISNNDGSDRDPQIYGDYVVWEGSDGNDLEIYLYRISTATLFGNISNNNWIQDYNPRIYGNFVVWQSNDGSDSDIYLLSANYLIPDKLFSWNVFMPAIINNAR